MAARRVNPRVVKLHRSYSVPELAACLGVHKNTIRHWQTGGLVALEGRPTVFAGETVRAFLMKRNSGRKRPCPPGTLYCFRCREARAPAGRMIDYVPIDAVSGNVRAICATCETIMHRRARKALLAAIMPGCDVQNVQAPPRLKGSPLPSLICDKERKATR
jgi:hypothetical protein